MIIFTSVRAQASDSFKMNNNDQNYYSTVRMILCTCNLRLNGQFVTLFPSVLITEELDRQLNYKRDLKIYIGVSLLLL